MPRRKDEMKLQWPETKKNHDSVTILPIPMWPLPPLLQKISLFYMLSRLSCTVLPSPLSFEAAPTEGEVITQKHR